MLFSILGEFFFFFYNYLIYKYITWRSLHEFARRESDLPHRFQSPLVLYTQTHRPPSTRPAYLLLLLIIMAHISIYVFLHYICAVIITYMFYIQFLALWKSIICVLSSQSSILTRMKPFLFPLTKFLHLFLQIFVRIVFLLSLIVQPLKQILMKSETKSKIWSAIIAAAVSLLTSIAQIFS